MTAWRTEVRPGSPRAAGIAGALGLLLVLALLQRPAPLFVNLGAGDAPFARGFRGGWERDGLQQTGETQFHWTQDGARIVLPVEVWSGRLEARLRLARFSALPVDMVVLAGEREVDRWAQEPRGWRVRTVDLDALRGPVSLGFRSSGAEGDSLGVALDWIEVRGAERVLPSARALLGLAGFFIAVPIVLSLVGGARLAVFVALVVTLAGSVAVTADRLGGLVALSQSAAPVFLVSLALASLVRWRSPSFPIEALAVPLAVVIVAMAALRHPFFYYPDVDTHARYLAAVRVDPSLLWDTRGFQARTGAWTRDVSGQRLAFPYSPAFHVLAWPLAALFGEVTAVKTVAIAAVASSLLLVHVLARCLGLGVGAAVLAQALFALLPVTSTRLTLALYPALLGQCLELMLLVHLARRYPRLAGGREVAVTALVLVLAQSGHTASIFNVGALVGLFVTFELAGGDRSRALRLATAYAAAGAVILAAYGRFVPVIWNVLFAAVRSDSFDRGGPGLIGPALGRLHVFYDVVPGLLAAASVPALRSSPRHVRRILLSALLAGVLLLFARFAVPVLLRDAREVEMLGAPVALAAAAALAWLWDRPPARIVALAGVASWMAWGGAAAVASYAERFVAIGR